MKWILTSFVILLFVNPAISQHHPPDIRMVIAAFRDSDVVAQILVDLEKKEMPPVRVQMKDTAFLYSDGHIESLPDKNENFVPVFRIKNIRMKRNGDAKLTGMLDEKIKMVIRYFYKGNNRWVISSRNIHTKGWWLKKGNYYFSSL